VSASAQPADDPPFRVVGTQPALFADFLQQTHVLNRQVIRSSQLAEQRVGWSRPTCGWTATCC
jgi:hypothetical protein